MNHGFPTKFTKSVGDKKNDKCIVCKCKSFYKFEKDRIMQQFVTLSIHLWHYYVKTFNILELGWREKERPASRGRLQSKFHTDFSLAGAHFLSLLFGRNICKPTNCWARKFSRTWRNSLNLPSGRHIWLADGLIGVKICLHDSNTEKREDRRDMVKLLADCHISSRIFPNFWY